MRYAIPVSNDMISPHFGHCDCFALFDVEEEKKEITAKELVPSPEHEPGLLPVWLAERGVSVVIAGGMGPRAQELFQQNNIKVVTGTLESEPDKAVISYMNNALSIGDNTCDH